MSGSWSSVFCSVLLDTEDSSVGSRLLITFLGEERDQISADEHPRDHDDRGAEMVQAGEAGRVADQGLARLSHLLCAGSACASPGASLTPHCRLVHGLSRSRQVSTKPLECFSPGVDRGS